MNKYQVGETVTQNRETFVLLERTDTTYPTTGEWALVRWKVGFVDSYGEVQDGGFYRAVSEIGVTPNTHKPEPIEGMNYIPVADEPEDVLTTSLQASGTTLDAKGFTKAAKKLERVAVKTQKKHRGRPAVAMNELKAKNAIRSYKFGKLDETDPLVVEAFDFLVDNGQETYLEKHFFVKS